MLRKLKRIFSDPIYVSILGATAASDLYLYFNSNPKDDILIPAVSFVGGALCKAYDKGCELYYRKKEKKEKEKLYKMERDQLKVLQDLLKEVHETKRYREREIEDPVIKSLARKVRREKRTRMARNRAEKLYTDQIEMGL